MTDWGDARGAEARGRPWLLIALAGLLVLVAAVYVGILSYMTVHQDEFIFEPSVTSGTLGEAGVFAAEADIRTADGETLRAWYRAPGRSAPLVIFLHGNKGSLITYADRINAYLSAGFGVLAIDYRGFGNSSGVPSLDGVIEDGRAALAFADRNGIPQARIALHGQSLGGMVATQLAAETDVGAVVLEAPFALLTAAATDRYWFLIPALVAPLIDGGIDPVEVIPSVEEPLLVMHGTDDAITPIAAGRAVQAAAPNAQPLLAVEGGTHGSLLADGAYEDAIAFIRERIGPT